MHFSRRMRMFACFPRALSPLWFASFLWTLTTSRKMAPTARKKRSPRCRWTCREEEMRRESSSINLRTPTSEWKRHNNVWYYPFNDPSGNIRKRNISLSRTTVFHYIIILYLNSENTYTEDPPCLPPTHAESAHTWRQFDANALIKPALSITDWKSATFRSAWPRSWGHTRNRAFLGWPSWRSTSCTESYATTWDWERPFKWAELLVLPKANDLIIV